MKAPVEAPNMLWLIQRDFLEGKTVQLMVSEALSQVPNPTRSMDIAQVCASAEILPQRHSQGPHSAEQARRWPEPAMPWISEPNTVPACSALLED